MFEKSEKITKESSEESLIREEKERYFKNPNNRGKKHAAYILDSFEWPNKEIAKCFKIKRNTVWNYIARVDEELMEIIYG